MENTQESRADIVAEMRTKAECAKPYDDGIVMMLTVLADRLEAALKREADNIHRAMVLIAGIEIENSEDPPRLWTALEDAYDALSDALGTDGDTTADVEEAKATGRHFVVKPYGNAAKMRSALECIDSIAKYLEAGTIRDVQHAYRNIQDRVRIAISAPPRNCDRFGGDIDKLREACARERGLNPEEDFPNVFPDWLLAPSTAKESGVRK